MKKLSLLVGGMILSGAVLAQKPAADVPMTLEGIVGFNNTGAGLTFSAPAIRFRYFLTDNIAGRVTFGIANTTDRQDVFENADGTGATGEYTIVDNSWMAGIGGEYHFAGTDRLSPFGALNIMFGGGTSRQEGTNATNLAGVPGSATYAPDYSEEFSTGYSMFGVGLSGGVDFYFAENFYAGVELGLMWSTTRDKDTEASVTSGGTTTSTTIPGDESSSSIMTTAMPAMAPTGNLRLGWRF